MQINKVAVCGAKSEEIQPKFTVLCTEAPNHEGDHRTIYSVNEPEERKYGEEKSPVFGFEYRWPK